MPDADTIINLHQIGLWEKLVEAYEIFVPATIVGEARYYFDDEHQKQPIDLRAQVAEGRISELSAGVQDILELSRWLSGDIQEGLGAGETEALALIVSGAFGEGWFTTSDRLAIETLAALGFSERGIALEEALRLAGYTLSRQARSYRQLTKEYFSTHIRLGQERRIQGRGVIVDPFR